MNPKPDAGRRLPRAAAAALPVAVPRTHSARSAVSLFIIALGMGLVLAASLGAVFWLIATALHSASTA